MHEGFHKRAVPSGKSAHPQAALLIIFEICFEVEVTQRLDPDSVHWKLFLQLKIQIIIIASFLSQIAMFCLLRLHIIDIRSLDRVRSDEEKNK